MVSIKDLLEKVESKKFHNKVKKILEKSGFNIIKSDYYKKGPDIIAEADGYKIIVQCKCAERKDKYFSDLHHLIDEYSRKAEKEEANVAILALSNYTFPKKYLNESEREKILEEDKVAIWDDRRVEYYNNLGNALGEVARFPIYGDLGFKEEFDKPKKVTAIKIHQPGSEFFVFEIDPETLLKISYVFRRVYSPYGYQRMLTSKRIKKEIPEFLESQDSILPTNIICVFTNGITYDDSRYELEIPMKYSSVWIVDGQHRLYAFAYIKDVSKREKFRLVCAGFDGKDLPLKKQGKMFIDINYKAKKVNINLLLDLYEMLGLGDNRVETVKKLAKTKVFKDKIQRPGYKGAISLATFSLTSMMESLIKDDGMLRKWYKGEFEPEKYADYCYEVLKTYFTIISETFKDEWKDSGKYILATNRGIRALLRLLPFVLEYSGGIENEEKVREPIEALREFKTLENEKLKGLYLGEAGADKLVREWCAYIRASGVPEFAPEERQEIVQQLPVLPGERKKAEEFLKRWFSKLKGKIVGELAYIDKTTFWYLKLLPDHCKEIRLFVSAIDEEDKCYKLAEEMGNGMNLEIVKLKTPAQEEESLHLHERWLAGNNYEIDFGTDLKKKALGNKKHTIKIQNKPKLSPRYINFNKKWEEFKEYPKGIKIERFFPKA